MINLIDTTLQRPAKRICNKILILEYQLNNINI
jgi:hypothetical protein